MEDAIALAINAGVDMSMVPLDSTAVRAGTARRRRRQGQPRRGSTRPSRGSWRSSSGWACSSGRSSTRPLPTPSSGPRRPGDRPPGRGGVARAARERRDAAAVAGRATRPRYRPERRQPGQPARRLVDRLAGTQRPGGDPRGDDGARGPGAAAPRGTSVAYSPGGPVIHHLPFFFFFFFFFFPSPPVRQRPADLPSRCRAGRRRRAAAARRRGRRRRRRGPVRGGPGRRRRHRARRAHAQLVDELEATGKPVVVVGRRPAACHERGARRRRGRADGVPSRDRGRRARSPTRCSGTSPSGRLPVSWPRSADQLPLYYNQPGQAYDPRYAFGHGLSYRAVKSLDGPRAPWHASPGERISASVDVANVGRSGGRRTRSWPSSSPATAAAASWPSTASRPAATGATPRA